MQTNELSSHFYTPKKNLAGLPLILMVLHKIYDFYHKKTTTKKQKQNIKQKKQQKTSRYRLQAFDVYTHLWDKLVK